MSIGQLITWNISWAADQIPTDQLIEGISAEQLIIEKINRSMIKWYREYKLIQRI